jgi:uncharacterized protein (DUF433 family)
VINHSIAVYAVIVGHRIQRRNIANQLATRGTGVDPDQVIESLEEEEEQG